MPASAPPSQRPGRRPAPPRGPRYRATVALAVVFLLMAVSLPLWIDWVRRDRNLPALDLDPVPPAAAPADGPPGAAPSLVTNPSLPPLPQARQNAVIPPAPVPNTECRAYVFDRCNALRIPPEACLPIAQDGTLVPPAGGFATCRAAVDERLAQEARRVTATAGDQPPPRAPSPDAGASPAAEAPTAPAEEPPAVPPQERAQAMERALQVVEDLQRGAQNYATLPAAQAARLAELRDLAERSGSPEARALYHRMAARYGTPEPPKGTATAEAPVVQAAPSPERAPATTPELEEVRRLRDAARRDAGLPPGPPASAPEIAPSRLPEASENRL